MFGHLSNNDADASDTFARRPDRESRGSEEEANPLMGGFDPYADDDDADVDSPPAAMRLPSVSSTNSRPESEEREQPAVMPGESADSDLDRVFAGVGGYEQPKAAAIADDRLSSPDSQDVQAAQPAKKKPKKSAWASIGGGLSRFAKGLGGVVKNLSGYNLIRHGLIGANYNRRQARIRQKKQYETEAQLSTHLDPAKKSQLIEEMGYDGYVQEEARLQGKNQKYLQGVDRARIGLATNRRNYTGYNMVNNFKRAFSDGDLKSDSWKRFIAPTRAKMADAEKEARRLFRVG